MLFGTMTQIHGLWVSCYYHDRRTWMTDTINTQQFVFFSVAPVVPVGDDSVEEEAEAKR
jgi:hypothetical protein